MSGIDIMRSSVISSPHAVVLARVQPVEVGDTVLAAHDRLAVDQEAGDGQPAGRVHDPRIPPGPIEARAG